MIKIAPSILTWDFTEIGKTLRVIEKSGIDMLHLDVMDGHFVPNITFGPAMVESIRKKTDLILDVHLMIEKPEKFVNDFSNAGADIINVHVEATNELSKVIEMIKKKGLKAAVTLNPGTNLDSVKNHLSEVDMVLLMTVNPGFGAQKFMDSVIPKIRDLKEIVSKKGLKTDIEVDGGINLETAPMVVKSGANILVAGNYIYSAKDISKAIVSLKNHAKIS